ncbi:TetR family transcriptional regulator [Glutamicibacter mysorens]|uniref:TetR family transcriptional regulator n=1 Tax=Glutamicibacter mysorens TaxID=257984 RepID=A0ABX4MZ54_9MICC|nr:TetR/AcrR family transcriptional regulator [Glutamicibacter mysorens]PJJ44710.1 TetR family transcriptional regulator [Glutamicibacter mysorens]
MPKIVDHDQRRREIVEVTWRFIAREGIEKLNLRDLAAAAGYSNGAFKPYFPTRDALLAATFRYVAEATDKRIARKCQGQTGIAAIEAFAREVLPLDELRRNEARIAVHFWHLALGDRALAAVNAGTMDRWRTLVDQWLEQLLGPDHPTAPVARDSMINFLMGAQTSSVLDEAVNTPDALEAQLQYRLEALRSLRAAE